MSHARVKHARPVTHTHLACPHAHLLQALRDLNQLLHVADVELCSAAALLQVHECAKVVDHDAVLELHNKLEVCVGSMLLL